MGKRPVHTVSTSGSSGIIKKIKTKVIISGNREFTNKKRQIEFKSGSKRIVKAMIFDKGYRFLDKGKARKAEKRSC